LSGRITLFDERYPSDPVLFTLPNNQPSHLHSNSSSNSNSLLGSACSAVWDSDTVIDSKGFVYDIVRGIQVGSVDTLDSYDQKQQYKWMNVYRNGNVNGLFVVKENDVNVEFINIY
jgi:hypothetical protein